MISFSNNPQRHQIKLRLGNPTTATVADLDDWLADGRSGNYLYFKQHKDGSTTASSKHYGVGLDNKPPKSSRFEFRGMVISMARAHVNDQDAAVELAAQALLDFCLQNGTQKGLKNLKDLRAAVHALRLALDARAAQQALPVDGEASYSGSGALPSPRKPSQASESSVKLEEAPEPDRRTALKQRAVELRRAVKARQAPTGDAAKERFAKETAAEFGAAIDRGRCKPQQLVAYYLNRRGRFSMGGKTPAGALAELLACLDDTQLLGLLPEGSVDSFIDDLLALQRQPWDYDSDSRNLRETLTRSSIKWCSLLKENQRPEGTDPLLLGGARNMAQRVNDEYTQGRASLLSFCLDWLTPYATCPRKEALFALESLIENGLLGLLSPEHTMLLIDEFVIAKCADRSNLPIPY